MGVMVGFVEIAFHDTDFQKNKITITGQTGEIKGLVFGDRLVRCVQDSFIFSEEEKVYCCISWGAGTNKGKLSKI